LHRFHLRSGCFGLPTHRRLANLHSQQALEHLDRPRKGHPRGQMHEMILLARR
jgi:hypothetical protein